MFAVFTMSAQERNFKWGFKFGANIAKVTDADGVLNTGSGYRGVKAKNKPSICLGAFVDFDIYKGKLHLQPEIVYSRQGFKYEFDGMKIWNRLNYLNVPVLLKFRPAKVVSIDMGPQFGFLLNAKQKIEGKSRDAAHSMTDECRSVDFGLVMGLTLYSHDLFDFSFRYNLGLTKVNEGSESKSKNRVWQFTAGVRF